MHSGIKRKEAWENPVAKQIPNETTTSYTKTAKDLMKEQLEQIAKSVLQATNINETRAHLGKLKELEDQIRQRFTKEEEAELIEPLKAWFNNFKFGF